MTTDGIDWADAGAKLNDIQARMFHEEHSDLTGAAFTGESLRRLFERIGHNWVPLDEHTRVLEANRSVDRANGEQAQKTLKHWTAEYERKMADSARLYAEAIRAWATEHRIPSRYRREGVLLAADWLDPDHKPEDAR